MFVTAAGTVISGYLGLVASFHYGVASAPAIILTANIISRRVAAHLPVWSAANRVAPWCLNYSGHEATERFDRASGVNGIRSGRDPFCQDAECSCELYRAADVVKQVGGEHVNLKKLLLTEFEPSPNDARELKAADVTFISGEGLKSWFERLVKASGYSGSPLFRRHQDTDDGRRGRQDHHRSACCGQYLEVWVGNIEKARTAADPEDAAIFKANVIYTPKVLKDLDAYAKAKLETVPKDRRKIFLPCIRLLLGGMAPDVYSPSASRPRQRLRLPTLVS